MGHSIGKVIMREEHNNKNKPEILAPVGSWQCFWAALDNGADSFYAGLKSLNARDLAPNFDLDEMYSLVETAHKYNKKIYVTLNSLVKESEIKELIHLLCALNQIKPDGLIIQDLSVLYLCKQFFPNIELHASTLMGFHNSIGVITAKELGFKRVVLARELTLEEIKACCRVEGAEIEIFVAGALCFSISGLCLMSSFLGGKSSMRGKCVQPCRRRYSIKNKFGYFFSMKDLCLIDFVPQLTEIGVKAFKIEGRLRPAHYVASMVKAFRIAIDDFSKLDEARKIANSAYGRPHTTAYIKTPHPEDAIDPSIAPNTGLYAGKILDVLTTGILVDTELDFVVGDKIRLVDKKKDLQENFNIVNVERTRSGVLILSLDTKKKDVKQLNSLFKKGILIFKISSIYKSRERQHIQKRLKLTSIIKIEKEILRQINYDNLPKKLLKRDTSQQIILKLKNVRQLSRSLLLLKASLNPDIINLELSPNLKVNIKAFNYLKKKGLIYNIIWSLPVFIPENNIQEFRHSIEWLFKKGCRNFVISNLGHLFLLKSISRKITVYGGYQLNLANSLAIRAVSYLGIKRIEFSIDSDQNNLKSALRNIPNSIKVYNYAFGLVPLFTSRIKHIKEIDYYPIVSPKKEKFFLIKDNFLEYLLPQRPINLLRDIKLNKSIDGVVIDFRFQHEPFKNMLKNKKDISKIPGDKFNWYRNWH